MFFKKIPCACYQQKSFAVVSNPAGATGAARYMRTSASGPLNRRSQANEVGLLQKG